MKVIEAISDTNIGGAGRLLLTRLKNSNRDEIETAVILPRGSRLEQKLCELGVKTYAVDGCIDKSFDISAVRKIRDIIKEVEPDIVNAHGCMSARLAAWLCRAPIRIHTRHCTYPVPRIIKTPPIKQLVGGVSMLLSNRAIAVADAARKDLTLMGVSEERIRVIINGVDPLRKYSDEERYNVRSELGLEGHFAVGICARLEKCKDHECFLRAARILCREDDRYRFVIIGDGSLMTDLRQLACSLGITDRVIFTGFTDDVEKYFNSLDLNVNCSVGTETSSLALSEGMSIGLPAVASSYGGNPYMVRHGENGFIYTKGDFAELADMIRRIANDKSLYKRMSHAAEARYASELNSKKMTAETESLYRELYGEYISAEKRIRRTNTERVPRRRSWDR